MVRAPTDILKMVKDNQVKIIDLRFCDLVGAWNHLQITPDKLKAEQFEVGIPFDASSIRGWQGIEASDMLMLPDPSTAKLDPFFDCTTLSLICNIRDPGSNGSYSRDPRNVALKATEYLKSTGIADTAYFAPEPEFFIFDRVTFTDGTGGSSYNLESEEGYWSSAKPEGNTSYKTRPKEGYLRAKPGDTCQGIRSEMSLAMEKIGISVECSHHEVAPAQHEISFTYDTLLKTADNLCWYKYIVRNIARQHGKVATFMPKPLYNDNGSGLHTNQSLWKGKKPIFAGDQYAGLSKLALYYIGGILKHARALAAFTNPSTNSYRRLIPGFEAPINLAYSSRNRSVSIRVPVFQSPETCRIEFRVPDATSNPYLAFSAMMLAGLDGIQNNIHPGEPIEKDIYKISPEELSKVPKMPTSLRESIVALKEDSQFLLQSGAFTEDLLQVFCDDKIKREINEIDGRPSPHEFYLYFDV